MFGKVVGKLYVVRGKSCGTRQAMWKEASHVVGGKSCMVGGKSCGRRQVMCGRRQVMW